MTIFLKFSYLNLTKKKVANHNKGGKPITL